MTFEKNFSPDDVLELVKKFGRNSNSFMTLYPGLEYFKSSNPQVTGTIAFLRLSHAWIGAAEPISSEEHVTKLIEEFATEAAKVKKTVILIPVGPELAKLAELSGYQSLFIGSEPTFDLTRYPKSGNTWIDVIPSAKHLDSRGAHVLEFDPSTCPPDKKRIFDAIVNEWLASRKMDPLGFLNKVEPWTLSQHKKYFYLELQGRILAFLAAIPIYPRNGWYLIDLARRNHAPAGTTELLALQAMRILRNQGALEITLGVSPLSRIDQVSQIPLANTHKHPYLYPFLNYIYKKGGYLYGFKSLYDYKLKFEPTYSSPMFLIYKSHELPSRLRIGAVINVFEAFLGKSIFKAIPLSILRNLKQIQISALLKSRVKNTIIVRSAPKTWIQLFYRCKTTLLLLLLNILFYIFTVDATGRIYPEIENQWSYSWSFFLKSPIQSLIFSPFLHWNWIHFFTNLILLFIFVGSFEFLAGTSLTAICYLLPMILSNPITSIALLKLNWVNPTATDIGASLGIFGCVGALSTLLKNGTFLMACFLGGSLLVAVHTQSWIDLNHWTSLILGFITGYIFLGR